MLTSNSFFNAAIQAVEDVSHSNSLIRAIKCIASWYKNPVNWDAIDVNQSNINSQIPGLGLVFQPVSSPVNVNNIFYPLLIQLKDNEEFIAVLPGKRIKDRLDNIAKVWQCISTQHKLPFSLYGVYLAVFQLCKKELLKSMSFSLVLSVIVLSIALLTGYIFNHLHDFNGGEFFSFYLCCLIFIIGFVFVKYLNEHQINKLNEKMQIYLLPAFWHQLLNTPLGEIKKSSSAINMQRISDYESSLSTVLTTNLMLVANMIGGLFLLIYMFYCNFPVSASYLVIYFFVVLFKLWSFSHHSTLITSYLSKQGRVATILTEALMQIDKIRSVNAENVFHNMWLQRLLIAKQCLEKSVKLEIKILLVDIALPLLMLLVLYLYLYVNSSWQSYDQLQYIICAAHLSLQFEKISAGAIALSYQLSGLKNIGQLINHDVEHTNYVQKKHLDNRDIILSNVSFIKDNRPVLENVTMRFPVGSFIGIMGSSGAGKSTVLKLILGLEPDYSGCIEIEGQDIKQQNMALIRQKMGVVLQTTNIFPGTIFSNIAANNSLTLNAAWQLAQEVGLYEDIQRMPMKMYTHISDNAGESISGGQKQKILIARALASRPQFLLLDEATSALDNKSQALIFKYLKLLNITLIVIAHRVSTIAEADLIYVLNNGKVVDQGSYKDVSERKKQLFSP